VAEAKAKSVADLLGTGMAVGEVTGLLGASERELRALRAAAGRRDEKPQWGEAVAPLTRLRRVMSASAAHGGALGRFCPHDGAVGLSSAEP